VSAIDPVRAQHALSLLLGGAEAELGRARARVSSLVQSISGDAAALLERAKTDGADAIDAAWISAHARDLAAAQAELAQRRERVRELESLIEFASADEPAAEGWFHERSDTGWSIFDENRLLVAVVPDAQHEREADARAIAAAGRRSSPEVRR